MASRVPELTDVVVLMGGWSVEREVSLASGKACTKALEEVGFRAVGHRAAVAGRFEHSGRVVGQPRRPVVRRAAHGSTQPSDSQQQAWILHGRPFLPRIRRTRLSPGLITTVYSCRC